uniref:Metalloendopeptidase n=1 Tax=Acrobeloides nanus TaxID=290746 RepID=A0A914C209_9BILA
MSYDLGSLMHYSPTEFSKRYNRYAITSNDPRYQQTIGNRMGLSFKDSKMINTRYCSNICKRKLECKNGGYTDPNNCRQCRCPDGLGGTYCDQLAVGNVPSCGGLELNATTEWQSIHSPRLRSNIRCYWRIRSPVGERLALYVQNISFPCRNACQNFVEVKYTHDKTLSGARFCCESNKKIFISDNNEVLVILRTSSYLSSDYTGFELFYKKHGSNLFKKKDKLKEIILS